MLAVPATLLAQNITPTGVTASSTFSNYNVLNLINNSGLSAGLHDATYSNMWLGDTNDVTPWLRFALGSNYDLTSASIWQYNYDSLRNRGVNGLRILISSNGVNFTLATTTTLTQSPGGNIPAQTVSFTGTARYVRFEVTSNHGAAHTPACPRSSSRAPPPRRRASRWSRLSAPRPASVPRPTASPSRQA